MTFISLGSVPKVPRGIRAWDIVVTSIHGNTVVYPDYLKTGGKVFPLYLQNVGYPHYIWDSSNLINDMSFDIVLLNDAISVMVDVAKCYNITISMSNGTMVSQRVLP